MSSSSRADSLSSLARAWADVIRQLRLFLCGGDLPGRDGRVQLGLHRGDHRRLEPFDGLPASGGDLRERLPGPDVLRELGAVETQVLRSCLEQDTRRVTLRSGLLIR